MLKQLVVSICDKLGDFEYEIVIADDASTDDTKSYFMNCNNSRISYVRSDVNQGLFKNILLGVENASSQVVWIVSDDDNIGDPRFAIEGANSIDLGEADLVFGRTTIKYNSFEQTSTHVFKPVYTSQEFIDSWFENINYLCLSSILYRKSILLECFPNTNGYMGNTLDYDIIYHAAKRSKSIIFIDKIAYIWTKSQPTSLSGKSKDDLLFQMMNIFAFPIANFSVKREYDVEFFNKYILDAVNTLVSNYHISHNETIFAYVTRWIALNNIEKIYIYGKGEVGLMLKQYLLDKQILIEFFIDDTIKDDDCITYDYFLLNKHLAVKVGVIIATYKSSVERKILKKLTYVDNVVYLPLLSLTNDC
jgi:glycosyltransferase involved in cell wall biosynthesis